MALYTCTSSVDGSTKLISNTVVKVAFCKVPKRSHFRQTNTADYGLRAKWPVVNTIYCNIDNAHYPKSKRTV